MCISVGGFSLFPTNIKALQCLKQILRRRSIWAASSDDYFYSYSRLRQYIHLPACSRSVTDLANKWVMQREFWIASLITKFPFYVLKQLCPTKNRNNAAWIIYLTSTTWTALLLYIDQEASTEKFSKLISSRDFIWISCNLLASRRKNVVFLFNYLHFVVSQNVKN